MKEKKYQEKGIKMKLFTKNKVEKGKYRIGFNKDMFAILCSIHPYAMNTFIATFIKKAKTVLGVVYFLDPEQDIALNKILHDYKAPKLSYEKHILITGFENNYQNTEIQFDIEKAPDILDKIYRFVYGD